MSRNVTFNIPISKVDEEQRMVWGIATSEAIDSQDDIVDYEASKKAFSSWVGNIREMHQPVAVGKAIDIQFDDDARQVMLGVKVSESADGQNAWTKVLEGVLTGFSIGGKVFKTVRETVKSGDITKNVNRVVDYALSETSLVDNPACPDAKFVMVKSMDGGLQRVEKEEDPQKPFAAAWWVKSYMPTIENAQKLYDKNMGSTTDMKKGMWDASMLLDLAIELGYYINSEEYEGDDASELKSALDTIKNAIVKELTEPTETLTVAVELAQKITNLKKGKDVAEEAKVEKTNVVGGEERDTEAKVVVNDAPVDESNVQKQPEEAPAEEKPAEKKEDKKEEPKSEKSSEVADLMKSVQTLLTKLDAKPKDELQKAVDAIGTKVDSTLAALEERLSKVEAAPVPPKAKASYVEVNKGEETVNTEYADLVKRSDHLAAHPEDAKPGEIEELTLGMRKAASVKQG